MKPLTWQGDMGFGPPRDGKRTFQRLDLNPRWTGIPDLDDAGPRAIRAYLRAYGPATVEHIHYWLGNGLSAGRKRLDGWISQLRDQLVAVDIEGATAYVVQEDVDNLSAAEPSRAVRFLPGHDQWVMGPGTKDVHVTPPSRRGVVTRKANLVTLGGVVCGSWTRTGDQLTVAWLDDEPPPEGAVEQETARLSGILDRDLHLRLRP